MDIQRTYKAFRVGPYGPRYLFHGIGGTCDVPLDTWVRAECKPVRDGTGPTFYDSGFHSLPSEEAVDKWRKLTKKEYPVIQVLVANTRPKTHSKGPVILSEWLYVPSENWNLVNKEAQNDSSQG